MADKKVYIVRGSEDGNLGVFSNYKKAYAKAVKYISAEKANEYEFKDKENGNHSYSATQRIISKYERVLWSTCGETVEIELFILNQE